MSAIGHNRQVCGVSSCSRQWFHTFASDTRPPITRSRVLLDDDGDARRALRGIVLADQSGELIRCWKRPMICGGGLPTPASAAARLLGQFGKAIEAAF